MISFAFSTLARARPKRNLLDISSRAAERILELMKQQNDPSMTYVKIGLKKRGCNGLSYTMNYCTGPDKLDEVIEDKGVKVIVDAKAVMVLVGTEMDFVEDDIKSEFVFRNPNEKVLLYSTQRVIVDVERASTFEFNYANDIFNFWKYYI